MQYCSCFIASNVKTVLLIVVKNKLVAGQLNVSLGRLQCALDPCINYRCHYIYILVSIVLQSDNGIFSHALIVSLVLSVLVF